MARQTKTSLFVLTLFIALLFLMSGFALAQEPTPSYWNDNGNYDENWPAESGSGTIDNPYKIKNAAELAAFAVKISTTSDLAENYVKLTGNIDLKDHFWPAITTQSFTDLDFDGGGHTISNMVMNTVYDKNENDYNKYGYYAGFISHSKIANLNIHNLTFSGAQLTSYRDGYTSGVGTVIGLTSAESTLDSITVSDSNIRGWTKVGGLIGFNANKTITTTIKNCNIADSTTITGGYDFGGLVGLIQSQGVTDVLTESGNTFNGTFNAIGTYYEKDGCTKETIAGVGYMVYDDGSNKVAYSIEGGDVCTIRESTTNTPLGEHEGVTYTLKQGDRPLNYVAKIGENYYTTLAAAVTAAEDDTKTTITLIDDCDTTSSTTIGDGSRKKNIILDMNGKTYTWTNTTGSTGDNRFAIKVSSGSTLKLTDSSTGTPGSIEAEDAQARAVAVYGTLEMEKVSVSGKYAGVYTYGKDASFTMNSGAIKDPGAEDDTGDWYGVVLWGSGANAANPLFTMNGGEISSKRSANNSSEIIGISGNGNNHDTKVILAGGTINISEGAGLYQPQRSETTISGVTINAITPVDIRAGKLTMTDGTLNSVNNTPSSAPDPNYANGPIYLPHGILIKSHKGYDTNNTDSITVSIEGGTITSENGSPIFESVATEPSAPSGGTKIKSLSVTAGTFTPSTADAPVIGVSTAADSKANIAPALNLSKKTEDGMVNYYPKGEAKNFKVGKNEYSTIEEALKAVTDGGDGATDNTIIISVNVDKAIIANKSFTLDGQGMYSVKSVEVAGDKTLTLSDVTVDGNVIGEGSVKAGAKNSLVTGDVKAAIADRTNTDAGKLFIDGAATGYPETELTDEYVYVGIDERKDLVGGRVIYASANIETHKDKDYVEYGADVKLIAKVDSGYRFTGWTYSPDVAPWETTSDTYTAKRGYTFGATFDVPVTSITLIETKDDAAFDIDHNYTPETPTIEPDNATNKTVTWSSSNSAIATVDATTGIVTGKSVGVAKITATAADGSNVNASYKAYVKPTASFSATSYTLYTDANKQGTRTVDYTVSSVPDTTKLSLVVLPGDEKIFTPPTSGKIITAKAKGEGRLYLDYEFSNGDHYPIVSVPVKVLDREGLSVEPPSGTTIIETGATYNLFANLTRDPESGYTDDIKYSISGTDSGTPGSSISTAGVITASGEPESISVTIEVYNGETKVETKTFSANVVALSNFPESMSFTNEMNDCLIGTGTEAKALIKGVNGYSIVVDSFNLSVDSKYADMVTISGSNITGLKSGLVPVTATFKLKNSNEVESPTTYTALTNFWFNKVDPEKVAIDQTTPGILFVGDTLQLTATASKEGFTGDQVKQTVTWESGNTDKATVSASGLVTAVAATDDNTPVNITAAANNKTAAYALTIYAKPTGLTITGGANATKANGDDIGATVAGSAVPLIYESSNETVVDTDGKCVGVGTADVTVRTTPTANGFQLVASQRVTVVEKITSVAFVSFNGNNIIDNKISMKSNESGKVILAYNGTGAAPTDPKVTYTSSDPTRVTVDQNGNLVALKKTADSSPVTITATVTTADGSIANATLTVTVTSPLTALTLPSAIFMEPNDNTGIQLQLVATPADADLTGVTVAYTCVLDANSSGINVDENGKVTTTETATGSATITATYDAGKPTTCKVTVEDGFIVPTSTTLTEQVAKAAYTAKFISKDNVPASPPPVNVDKPISTLLVNVGTPKRFDVKLEFDVAEPTNAYTNVQAVNGDGTIATATLGSDNKTLTIEGMKPGICDVSVLYTKGYVYATYRVNVINPINGIKLADASKELLIGEQYEMSVSYVPFNRDFAMTDTDIVQSDVTVTFVGEDGVLSYDGITHKLTALKAGSAKATISITVKTKDDPIGKKFDTDITVAVKGADPQSLDLGAGVLTLVKGEDEAAISPIISPSNTGLEGTVEAKTANASIATVRTTDNSKFSITPVGTGVTTITFTVGSGTNRKTATLDVAVLPVGRAVSLTPTGTFNWAVAIAEPTAKSLEAAKAIKYSSGKPDFAEVGPDGVIIAKREGVATITALYGNRSTQCVVTVTETVIPVEGITLDKASVSLQPRDTTDLKATVTPSNGTNTNVAWTSSNPEVATVTVSGMTATVKALKDGMATITATTEDGNHSATCQVTVTTPAPTPVNVPVTGVTLEPETVSVKVGGTATLTATVAPENATNKEVTFSSGKPEIATVDANGVVTAIAEGEAVITVTTTDGGFTDTSTVTVTTIDPPKPSSISLDKASLELVVKDTAQIVATTEPEGLAVTWQSDNKKVATVDQEGTVTAISMGEATITASVEGASATCRVKVIDEFPVKLEFDVLAMLKNKKRVIKAPAGVSVKWSSSDETIATINANGKIATKKKLGTAIITCEVTAVTDGASGIKVGDMGRLTLNVRPKGQVVTKVVPDFKKIAIKVDGSFDIRCKLKPAKAPDRQLRFSSGNTAVATVDKFGTVTGVSLGEAKITILSTSGKKSVITVTVTDGALKISVTPKKKTLYVLETVQLKVETKPAGSDVVFTSKNPAIATVDENGLVTALSKGKTTIVITAPSGVKATVMIKVK